MLEGLADSVVEADADPVLLVSLEAIAEADGDLVFKSDILVVYDSIADTLGDEDEEASKEALGVRVSK